MTTEQIKLLDEQYGLQGAIDRVRKTMVLEFPKRPKKPILKEVASSNEVEQYLHELRAWEKADEEYHQLYLSYVNSLTYYEEAIEEYIKVRAGLYDLPAKAQGKVWSMACDLGRYEGYASIYYHLEDLVNLFE